MNTNIPVDQSEGIVTFASIAFTDSVSDELRRGFTRPAGQEGSNKDLKTLGSSTSSPTSFGPVTPTSAIMPAFPAATGSENAGYEPPVKPEQPKYFFQEKYAKLGVRGNFMPLAAQPKNVDLGDWLAHQVTEQFKLLNNVLQCIQEVDTNTNQPLCNPESCPTMSAAEHTYTWLNQQKQPVKVSAPQYIQMVQKWISGKTFDPNVFPTGPFPAQDASFPSGGLNTSASNTPNTMGPATIHEPFAGRDWIGKAGGFPEHFFNDVRSIFRQMHRIYAHIYHNHWVDPFWHIASSNPASAGWTDLNSCFVHFVTVAKLFGLLSDRDTETMQPLIDIWIANGSIPADAANGVCAVAQP